MLAYLVAAVGWLIALLGVGILVAPAPARDLIRRLESPRMLYVGVAFRIVVGAFFVFASEACARPLAIGTLGVVLLVAGFAGLFIGLARIQALMRWFLRRSDAVWRAWAVPTIVFGAFIVYAAV